MLLENNIEKCFFKRNSCKERNTINRPSSRPLSCPIDPDSRISVKPGKARKLNYAAQLTVDSGHHVITDIMADFADKKDNQSLQQVSARVKDRLHQHGLLWHNLLADTGYSSGENYAYLEREGLQSFIPPHGTYKGCPDQMTYDRAGDYYVCRNGKHLTHRKLKYSVKGTKENHYVTSRNGISLFFYLKFYSELTNYLNGFHCLNFFCAFNSINLYVK